jgi:multisubunit Na+/H+ antiporter MnhG subunit
VGNTIATSAASHGVVGAVAILICWILSLRGVTVPAEVAAAIMVIMSPIVHLVVLYVAKRWGVDPKELE